MLPHLFEDAGKALVGLFGLLALAGWLVGLFGLLAMAGLLALAGWLAWRV